MSSKDSSGPECSHGIKSMLTRAGQWYTTVKNTHPSLTLTLAYAKSLMSPVNATITKYSQPVLSKIHSEVTIILDKTINTLESYELSIPEKKKLYKASMKAWILQNHKNFSDFLQGVKALYTSVWRDYIESYVLQIYTKSLQYTKPSGILKFAADLATEGSDILSAIFIKAWKMTKNASITEFYNKVYELSHNEISKKDIENAEVFVSLSKIKEKAIDNKGFARDWAVKAMKSAELTSLIVLMGADEIYFWTQKTFTKGYRFVMLVNVTVKVKASEILAWIYNPKDIMDLSWPEELMNGLRPMIKALGYTQVAEKFWEDMDADEDGVVSIGDLVEIIEYAIEEGVKKVKESSHTAWRRIKSISRSAPYKRKAIE